MKDEMTVLALVVAILAAVQWTMANHDYCSKRIPSKNKQPLKYSFKKTVLCYNNFADEQYFLISKEKI